MYFHRSIAPHLQQRQCLHVLPRSRTLLQSTKPSQTNLTMHLLFLRKILEWKRNIANEAYQAALISPHIQQISPDLQHLARLLCSHQKDPHRMLLLLLLRRPRKQLLYAIYHILYVICYMLCNCILYTTAASSSEGPRCCADG